MSTPDFLDSALALAGAGFRVHPLRPGSKLPATAHGCKDATSSLDAIRTWWGQVPDANIGIATGGGLVVIDTDAGKPWPLPSQPAPGINDGADVLVSIAEQLGQIGNGAWIFSTADVRTPSGGLHFYYEAPVGAEFPSSAGQVGPWVDVRGEGGYVVAPWSITVSGPHTTAGTYTPVYGWDLTPAGLRVNMLPLPEWLGSLLVPQSRKPRATPDRWVRPTKFAPLTDSRYVQTALAIESHRVRTAPTGSRNETLNRAAYSLATLIQPHGLTETLIHDALLPAALDAGLPSTEANATIRSGITAGRLSPRKARP